MEKLHSSYRFFLSQEKQKKPNRFKRCFSFSKIKKAFAQSDKIGYKPFNKDINGIKRL